MGAKVIDERVIQEPEKLERLRELVRSIKNRHALINAETKKMEEEKAEIKDGSTKIFFEDIESAEIPQLHTSHEYHFDDDLVRISFKVRSRPMSEIGGKAADEVLDEVFKEHAGKLFDKDESYTVEADELSKLKQACDHPELFRVALKPLTAEQLKTLAAEHPEFIAAQVTDVGRYAKLYPQYVSKKTTVSVKKGFLEVVDTIEGAMKKKARKFLSALLKPSLSPAVVVGNRTKK